jgi:ParB-like chromosome segregation protein Spo0J
VTLAVMPPVHPAASLFPEMTDEEFAALRESIREYGQQEPCVLLDGAILDGRHRWRACVSEGVEPLTQSYRGECGSPTAFVIAKNLNRRHLNASQRAAVATEALPLFEEEAAKRRRATLKQGEQQPVSQIVDERGRAAEQAAKAAGTNRQYVSDAKKLKEEAPDLFVQVREGEKTIPQAKREAEQRQVAADHGKRDRTLEHRSPRYANSKVRAVYDDGVNHFYSGMLPLDLEVLNSSFDTSDQKGALDYIRDKRRWLDQLERAVSKPLRVVGGSRS